MLFTDYQTCSMKESIGILHCESDAYLNEIPWLLSLVSYYPLPPVHWILSCEVIFMSVHILLDVHTFNVLEKAKRLLDVVYKKLNFELEF